MMDNNLQWAEGKFLAIEALRQGGEEWLFPLPPRSFDALPSDGLPETTEMTAVFQSQLPGGQKNKHGSSRQKAKHLVD